MRSTTPFRALLVVVPAAILLAGCGGGGSSGASANTDTSSAGSTAGSGGHSGAYQGGFAICGGGTIENVAATYGAPEPTPEAVSNTVAEAVSGGTPGDVTDAKQGCLDALAKAK